MSFLKRTWPISFAIAITVLTFVVFFPLNQFSHEFAISRGLGFLTLVGEIFLVTMLVTAVVARKTFAKLTKKIGNYAVPLTLLVSTVAMLGSLYFSNIRLLPPCTLCWYQRIFIYPIAFIAVSALIKKKKQIAWVVSPLAVIAFLISGFHYVTQYFGIETSCSPTEAVGACQAKFIYYFGHITIPLMAFVAVTLILYFMYASSKKK